MPIRKENRACYPPEWKALRRVVLTRASWQCEGTPARPDCRALHGLPHPETGAKVVLTTAHMDRALDDHGLGNLRALCQKCHNGWDGPSRAAAARQRRQAQHPQQEIGYG